MLNKSFEELRKIDVRPFCEKRDGMDYLNWAKCKALLHENGAEKVYFTPVTNVNGSSLFMSDVVFSDKNGVTNRCYEVRVHIVIDDLEWDYQTPLMNGANPVKDNSMSQQRVWNAQTRAFVKGVAMMTGLGFDLWLKEEEGSKDPDDSSQHNILAIKKRCEEAITSKLQRGMDYKDILNALGLNENQLKKMMGYFDTIYKFEAKLNKI